MKLGKSILVISSLLMIVVSLSAQPRGEGGHGPHGPEGGMKHHRIWAELNLNEDQKVEIKKLHEEMNPIRKKHREEMKAVREKVRDEMNKENSDRATLTTYSREMAELHFKQAEAMADHLLKIKVILTPEQFKKMTELHEKRKEMWKQKKGYGKGHGKGHCTD